jgi:hypothetical protein
MLAFVGKANKLGVLKPRFAEAGAESQIRMKTAYRKKRTSNWFSHLNLS